MTVFASEKEAYEGGRALKEMHDEGSIVLYARESVQNQAKSRAESLKNETEAKLRSLKE